MKKFLLVIVLLAVNLSYLQAAEIICPDTAPLNSPVIISISPLASPETTSVKFIKEGFSNSDSFLELFDAKGNPVTIFWSSVAGPRRMTLITASCNNTYGLATAAEATAKPTIEYDVHILNYGGSTPPPPPPPDEPDAVFKDRVRPLLAYINATNISDTDKKLLASFYKQFSDSIASSNITDTGKFREAYIAAGTAYFNSANIKGKYSGLADIVDKVLVDTLGLDNVAFSPQVRAEAVKALKAVAWTFSR